MKTLKQIFELKVYTYLIVVLVMLLSLSSCTKDEDTTEPKPAPTIPPASTFAMDFNDFSNIDTTAYKSGLTYNNWGWAAWNTGVWNAILTITFAVPVASFYESFNHQGVWNPSEDKWIWSYNFMAGGVVHLAELKASLVIEGVKWEMYLSKTNSYNDFLWYHGISNLTNTEGEWHLNENPSSPGEIILIEWHRNSQGTEADIKYTNVKQGAPENGGYIFYGINISNPFDAFYNIYGASADNLLTIEWNRTTKNGRVMDEAHFGNTDWHCWDEMLMDIDCP
jgi:hypothetical protein